MTRPTEHEQEQEQEQDPVLGWRRLGEMWSAEQAEHVLLLGYELTAFVIPADPANGWERQTGWEVHGGAGLLDLITTGNAASFADAKAQAEAAFRALAKS